MDDNREFTLVSSYRKAKANHTAVKDAEKDAKAEVLKIEAELINLMVDKNIERTAKYTDIGFVTLNKPKVRASYTEINKFELFEFLKKEKREDMIKTSVHPGTLSTFVKEILAEGKEPPNFIGYYLQNTLTLTKK